MPSRPHPRTQEGFLALGTTREISGAHLGPIFGILSVRLQRAKLTRHHGAWRAYDDAVVGLLQAMLGELLGVLLLCGLKNLEKKEKFIQMMQCKVLT